MTTHAKNRSHEKVFYNTTMETQTEKSGQLHPSWQAMIGEEFNKPYMDNLHTSLKEEKANGKIIFSPSTLIFNAFNHIPFEKMRVVIIGGTLIMD